MPELAFSCVGTFDRVNPRAVEWASDHAAALVTEVDAATRDAIRQIVVRSFEEGIPPEQAARLMRSVVGLHSRDAQAVASLRADLVRRGASEEFAARKAERYAEKLLNARCLMIARTEVMAAANRGQEELWRQAAETGQLPADVRRVWIVTPDDDLCPECAELDGALAQLDLPYPGAGGPGPPLHPNCRCVEGIATPEDLARAGIEPAPEAVAPPEPALPAPEELPPAVVEPAEMSRAEVVDQIFSRVSEEAAATDKKIGDVLEQAVSHRGGHREVDAAVRAAEKDFRSFLESQLSELPRVAARPNFEGAAWDELQKLGPDGEKLRSNVQKARDWYRAMWHNESGMISKTKMGLNPLSEIGLDVNRRSYIREYYENRINTVHLSLASSSRAVVHEMGHATEYTVNGLLDRVLDFLERRIEKGHAESLGGEMKDERAFFDKFKERYTGKVYLKRDFSSRSLPFPKIGSRFDRTRVDATEVMSTGLEQMYANPFQFYKSDKDFFEFVLRAMTGGFK